MGRSRRKESRQTLAGSVLGRFEAPRDPVYSDLELAMAGPTGEARAQELTSFKPILGLKAFGGQGKQIARLSAECHHPIFAGGGQLSRLSS